MQRWIQAYISREVERALKDHFIDKTPRLDLTGYNPMPQIKRAMYEWLLIPYNGANVLMQIRYLNTSQLPPEHNYNQIMIDAQKPGLSMAELVPIKNAMEALCKVTLNNPTFEEIEQSVQTNDRVICKQRVQLAALKDKLEKNKDVLGTAEKRELVGRINALDFQLGYILPNDTMAALTRIALGSDISDIKKLTKDALLRAYWKAKIYNKAPHDFISGFFTDRDQGEIDDAATYYGLEAEKNHRQNSRIKPK